MPNTRLESLGLPKDLLLGGPQTEQRHTLGQQQQLSPTFHIRYVLIAWFSAFKYIYIFIFIFFKANFFKGLSRSLKLGCRFLWFCGATLPYSSTQICIFMHARHRFSPTLHFAPWFSSVTHIHKNLARLQHYPLKKSFVGQVIWTTKKPPNFTIVRWEVLFIYLRLI